MAGTLDYSFKVINELQGADLGRGRLRMGGGEPRHPGSTRVVLNGMLINAEGSVILRIAAESRNVPSANGRETDHPCNKIAEKFH